MTAPTADDREKAQRPETAEQRQTRLRAIWRNGQQERREEAERLLSGLELNPHVLRFAQESAKIMRQADGGGGGVSGDGEPVGPLNAHQQEMCERVCLCKRVNELREEGAGYMVVPQAGADLKEDGEQAGRVRRGSKLSTGY
jgi:hypothetical protein